MKCSIKKVLSLSLGLMLILFQCPMPLSAGGHETAAVYISGGERISENEYADDTVLIDIADGASGIDENGVDGVHFTSTDYEATGIVVSDGSYQIGGQKDYFTVYSDIENDYVGTSVASTKRMALKDKRKNRIGSFNTVLLFGLDADVNEDATTGSSGIDADNEAVVYIDNAYLQVDGAQRYVDSSYSSSTTIVNDSYLVSTGNAAGYTDAISEPFSNGALLISGTARTNFSISATDTYYFNSTVIAEGWAALSTDSSTGDGLDLYAYNTVAKALNGGYATYADFGCRVWLYGSLLEAAEIGAIIAKSGSINILDGASADDSLLALNKGKTNISKTVLAGGRNAVMLHAPDMMGTGLDAADCGNLEVSNSRLETRPDLESTFDYSSYSEAVQSYVDYVNGDVILVKSTSTDINLYNTELKTHNGVLLHSVLNSDSMGNFLAEGDNESVEPVAIAMNDMKAKGDILHEDYQR
ncbi:MAG: hypothetical protein PVI54_19505, partial [Desulfobacteraceae bacterium]